MPHLSESDVEQSAIELLQAEGYTYLAPEEQENERQNLNEVVLKNRLAEAINRINPTLSEEAKQQALKTVLNLPSQNLIENNEAFHKLLTEGVEVEQLTENGVQGTKVWLVDWMNTDNNEFLVCNQFTVTQGNATKRPDVVLLVNGIPLVVIELKNPADENATIHKAFTQLQNYKNAISNLFQYNGLLVASDGLNAKAGSLTSPESRFSAWKTVDGVREDAITTPQIETLIKGMLRPDVLLDLMKQFTVFEKSKKEDPATGLTRIEIEKKIAAYHQYHAVNKAVGETLRASGYAATLPKSYAEKYDDKKIGVVWHTQGSGKSISMVFYTGKVVLEMENPTIVVITDRNDLDDQLFDTFAGCKQLLRQDPVQAKSRDDMKKLLTTAGGGIIFTTIQKFFPDNGTNDFDLLSERKNIVVIADEAHRSQYGFAAKTHIKNQEVFTKYGFAKYLRDGLPNASFIGFTGTPIEKEDVSTPAVFGNYIDIYDIEQAVEDGSTVPIYYESRLAKIHLKEEETANLDEEIEAITEGEEPSTKEKAKAKWAQLEAIIGNTDRIKIVAQDIIDHFEKRQEVFEGKAMIVAMSRRIAVELYEQIIALRPDWHDPEKRKGVLKVVMTSTSSDPENWQLHNTSKDERKMLAERMKDTADPLKLVIVRDMWRTGSDVPCLHTMYVDNPMNGHNLMQSIARVNRVFKDKPGGLIVDYIGIASSLKHALSIYAGSGGRGEPTHDQAEAVATMLEKYEVVSNFFEGFDYKRYFTAGTNEKMKVILEAQEHILGLDQGKDRFTKEVTLLSKAFALAIPDEEAMNIKDDVGFFQAVKACLSKFEPSTGKSSIEIETAIRQIMDKAVVAEGVVDIFDAAGIKKPNISILSDEFLAEIQGMEHKHLATELLKKILNDEIKTRSKKNMIQSRKFSEMLQAAIKRYQNNLITAAEIIEELIDLAKKINEEDEKFQDSGLTYDEVAFYDALANNESAKQVLGDETLRDLARILVQKVKSNAAIDWTIKESVQAQLRVMVKRTLREYGYPPDQQKIATDNILKQAELFAEEWTT